MEVRLPRKNGQASAAAGESAVLSPESHICAVLLAEFDITTGSSLRAVYPPNFFSEADIKQYATRPFILHVIVTPHAGTTSPSSCYPTAPTSATKTQPYSCCGARRSSRAPAAPTTSASSRPPPPPASPPPAKSPTSTARTSPNPLLYNRFPLSNPTQHPQVRSRPSRRNGHAARAALLQWRRACARAVEQDERRREQPAVMRRVDPRCICVTFCSRTAIV